MDTDPQAVALVESPAQLLNVLEWAAARTTSVTGHDAGLPSGSPLWPSGRAADGVVIVVLPPPEPAARVQLDRMAELARAAGATVIWREVRGGRGVWPRAFRTVGRLVRSAPVVVVGDPFSRMLQALVGLAGPGRLVIVDDGSATLEFVRILTDGGPLVRWHRSGRRSGTDRLIAARARRRMVARHPGRRPAGPLELFTAMPVHSSLVRINPHRFAWTRSRFARPALLPGTDLVGSSLVESGVIEERCYLAAVAGLAAAHGVQRYLAHRREATTKLARISELGLTVIRPDLPLELYARTGPVAARMLSFPSTVVHTLPLALADTPVEIGVCDITSDWYAAGHRNGRSDRFLSAVSTAARRSHGLAVVAAG